ncbi:hypothetical protein NIES19_45160 [Anabaena cylindrica PCC 7122]|nr:hypothetical protein NIES19_45160 [Anabaena cylindrica PCC 7122]
MFSIYNFNYHFIYDVLIITKKGTGNRGQIRNFSSEFKAQSKKTVSLFQSHVSKHEFFLFPLNPYGRSRLSPPFWVSPRENIFVSDFIQSVFLKPLQICLNSGLYHLSQKQIIHEFAQKSRNSVGNSHFDNAASMAIIKANCTLIW